MNSSIFDKNNYDYKIGFKQAKKNGQIVSIGDSQVLRSIRDITGRIYDKEKIEFLFNRRNEFKKLPPSKKNATVIYAINKKIQDMMFIPEYVSLVIDKNSHYKKIIKSGLKINGVKYKRFLCSASQARVNTIILISEAVYDSLYDRINNERKIVEINPSKENAYFGLASSATKTVSEPNICIIDDCIENRNIFVNWVTITEEELQDDKIEQKYVDMEFNLFDGMGLIKPHFASIWAQELGLDYVPAQFCIRHSFIKGMVCQFDIDSFCKINNNNNYMIKTLYGDYVDIRNYDIILTKSQFKMWNCYNSYEDYNEKCHRNKLTWGISQYSPKHTKDILTLNYQSLQTLKLSKEDIEELCTKTVDLFNNITTDNIYYTILCLLGENINSDTIKFFMQNSDNYWLKCLILNSNFMHDKYIQTKIYDNISTRLRNTYLGEIYVNGNYQCIISDPYAFMEHTCGLEVKGLLKNKEHYSNYWNLKEIKHVDAMRSPLTYRSEHNILNLIKNKDTEFWYKYLDSGIILNVHGDDVVRAADSDFDYDIIATTSNEVILRSIYTDSLPVAYEKGSTGKFINDYEDLCNADILAFGSRIGHITNKSTSMYAMLPMYEKDSEEYKELEKRLILTRVAQGNEIDRAKGIVTKPFPKHWTNYNTIKEEDTEEVIEKKNMFNNIIVDRKPLFFRYRYTKDRNDYKKYYDSRNEYSLTMFNKTIEELMKKENKSNFEKEFVSNFLRFSPLLDTDCEMNNISKYMASIEFNIRSKIKKIINPNIYTSFIKGFDLDNEVYNNIKNILLKYYEIIKEKDYACVKSFDSEIVIDLNSEFEDLKNNLNNQCSNGFQLCDYVVTLFYNELKSKNKMLMWKLCGKYIYANVKSNFDSCLIPVITEDDDFDFKYMEKKFKIKEIDIGVI